MEGAARCSLSVEPKTLAKAALLIKLLMLRLMGMRWEITSLCMRASLSHQIRCIFGVGKIWCVRLPCRPNIKGWLFTGVIAVLLAARICAKHTRV